MLKKLFLIVCSTFLVRANAQLVFQRTVNDYGTVPKAKVLFSEFIVTNTGTEEEYLLRLDGASNFSWSFTRAALKPGESDTIRIYYTPDKAGPFNERITVYLSSDGKPQTLEMKGVVKEVVKDDPMPCYSFRDAHPDLYKYGVIPKLDAQVVNAKTKQPIEGAFFQVFDGSFRSFFGYTKLAGTIEYNVSPGLHEIKVSADNYKSKSTEKYLNRESGKFIIELEPMDFDTVSRVATIETPIKKVEPVVAETTVVKVETVEKIDSIPAKVERVEKIEELEPVQTVVITKDTGSVVKESEVDKKSELVAGKLNPYLYTPNNIVLLIDVSGSMAKPDRLDLFIKQSHELIEKLRPMDRVSIIVYSQTAKILVPPTPAGEKRIFFKTLDSLKANGMTNANKGLELAYTLAHQSLIEGGNNQIVLATDGVFRLSPTDQSMVQAEASKPKDPIILSVLMLGISETAGKKLGEVADLGKGSLIKTNEDGTAIDLLLEEIKERSKK